MDEERCDISKLHRESKPHYTHVSDSHGCGHVRRRMILELPQRTVEKDTLANPTIPVLSVMPPSFAD